MKRLLDFCCKAGGASMGYHMAGYEVTGVDIEPQPHYPFEFHQDDFTKLTARQIRNIRARYDAVSISPPCQTHSVTKHMNKNNGRARTYLDLVVPARELCERIDLPYIIENVVGAPLLEPVQLCGSGLALRVQRHRLFESNYVLEGIECAHGWQQRHKPYQLFPSRSSQTRPGRMTGVVSVYGKGDGTHLASRRQTDIWAVAMGIDWMNLPEMAEAIPPAYTHHLGSQLIKALLLQRYRVESAVKGQDHQRR